MILLDLETTAVVDACCILSIGALNFNPNGTLEDLKRAPRLHMHLELSHQMENGRVFDEGTIKWLNEQPPAVIANAKKSATSKLTLTEAMRKLANWLSEQNGFDGNCHVRGIDFEGKILPHAAKMANLRFPINFSGYNDIRTLIRDYLDTTSSYIRTEMFTQEAADYVATLTKHIAIDDCLIDAVQIIEGRRIRDERIIKKHTLANDKVRAAVLTILGLDPRDGKLECTVDGYDGSKEMTARQGAAIVNAMTGKELSACELLDIAYPS